MTPTKSKNQKISSRCYNANDYKERGNIFYNQKKFHEAIFCYTRAIELNPSCAIFLTNRALCNLNLQRWSMVCQDCRMAFERDPSLIKAYFYSGQAYLEMEQYNEAIIYLSKANDLALSMKRNYGEDIINMLHKAKKLKWLAMEEENIKSERNLKILLERLIDEEKKRKCLEEENSKDITNLIEYYELMINNVKKLFEKSTDLRKNKEIPDAFCGKISFELMKDPVITPYGITYDRKDIEDHLHKVGQFDPVNRSKLKINQLIPNMAVKEIVDKYLAENPWSDDF